MTDKKIKSILFTNSKLEPYEPYWFHTKEKTLPHKYDYNFEEVAENAKHIYLD